MASRSLVSALRILLVMIIGLMALGASVRAMNAGLSCPDWPLCFGKVIPDFHPAVWFEFVHRAYAGLTATSYFVVFLWVLFAKGVPSAAKRAASAGLVFLGLLIAAGALTVLWQVKWFAVTSHLLLATLFFTSVLWTLLTIDPRVKPAAERLPALVRRLLGALTFLVFAQIALGGIVASTYAGMVCVDWPLCNGQWVPTWTGAIGHQLIHRFFAYAIALAILVLALVFQKQKEKPWMTRQLLGLSRMAVAVVLLQIGLGVANLLLYIPPWITVPHQSMAVILFATCVRLYQVARRLSAEPAAAVKRSEPAAAYRAVPMGGLS